MRKAAAAHRQEQRMFFPVFCSLLCRFLTSKRVIIICYCSRPGGGCLCPGHRLIRWSDNGSVTPSGLLSSIGYYISDEKIKHEKSKRRRNGARGNAYHRLAAGIKEIANSVVVVLFLLPLHRAADMAVARSDLSSVARLP